MGTFTSALLHEVIDEGSTHACDIGFWLRIDVFDVEPPPADHPLLHLENVIATPHTAGGTFETATHMSAETARQWITILRGQVPPRLVNPEAWGKYSDRFEKILGVRPDPLP